MSTTTAQKLLPVPYAESVKGYRPGGYHPVHLGDTFKDDRYKVVHKLGYGAYATVWLVNDTVLKRYSSLKILAAEVSDSHPEVAVLRHLQEHGTGIGKEYVVEVFDFFEHSGPNGIHQCIVMEVLWPCISFDTDEGVYPEVQFPMDMVKRMSKQIAHGLAYIHKAGVVHGDMHVGNILFDFPVIASWSSESDVEMYLDVPSKAQLRLWDSNELAPPSPHLPSYLVRAPNPRDFVDLCMSKSDLSKINVKICDFSEAFIPTIHLNPPPCCTPVVYASPELIFRDPTGPPADIWAFAVLLHFIVSLDFIFPSYSSRRGEVLKVMVLKLGKLPDQWWYKFEERGEYFNEDGKWIGNREQMYRGFDKLIYGIEEMNKAESSAYERLIRRMVAYDPEERASIDEVIEWMNQNGWVC